MSDPATARAVVVEASPVHDSDVNPRGEFDHESSHGARARDREAEGLVLTWMAKATSTELTERNSSAATLSAEPALARAHVGRHDIAVLRQIYVARASSQHDLLRGIELMRGALSESLRLQDDPGIVGLAEFWLANLLDSSKQGDDEVRALLVAAHHHLTQAQWTESAAACLILLSSMGGALSSTDRIRAVLTAASLHLSVTKSPVWPEGGPRHTTSVESSRNLFRRMLIEDGLHDKEKVEISLRRNKSRRSQVRRHTGFSSQTPKFPSSPRDPKAHEDESQAMLFLAEGMTACERGDFTQGLIALEAAQSQFELIGNRTMGAVIALVLAADSLTRRNDARSAIDRAVPAMLELLAFKISLPNSAERERWSTYLTRVSHLVFQAASASGDTQLMAELIVMVQSQSIPESRPSLHEGSAEVSQFLNDMPVDPNRAQATVLRPLTQIEMPWRRAALDQLQVDTSSQVNTLAMSPIRLEVNR